MNERPHLEAWSAAFFLAALVVGVVLALPDEGAVRQRTLPSHAAQLEQTEAGAAEGLRLTDLEGWTLTPHPDWEPEVLTRLSLDLDRAGQASVGALESRVSWRGIRLPEASRPQNPILDSFNEVRIKLLLYRGQTPVHEPGPEVRVVLKTGDEVHENFAALAGAIENWPPQTQIMFDARPGVPARHALTALAILCRSKRAFQIATPETPGRPLQPDPTLREALRRGAASVDVDERNLPRLGVRIRPDARCSWGAIQGALEALVQERVARLTLSGNAGDLEVDLFQPSQLRPGVREVLAGPVSKPIIIFEEEVEVETVRVPGSERGVHPPVSLRDPLGGPGSAEPTPVRPNCGSRLDEGSRGAVTAESEAGVTSALTWLTKHQRPDGTWRAQGADCCGGQVPGDPRYDVSVTSLALLAFLGNGQTHRSGRYKRVVNRGLRGLKALQKSDGSVGVSPEFPGSAYNHAYAAQALCDAYALSRDFTLKRPARKALDWILASQVPGSGWRCDPTSAASDRSLTSALIQALFAGRTAGLKLNPSAIKGAQTCLQGPGSSSGGPAARSARAQGKFDPLPSGAALALFAQLYDPLSDPTRALQGARVLMESLPVWDRLERKVDFHYWFAGSHAMVQVGGADSQRWLAASRQALLPHQEARGCATGSWAIRGELGHLGGRAYATALGALCLEAPYRYERAAR